MTVITHLCGGVTDSAAVLKARVAPGASSVVARLAQHPVPFGPVAPDANGMVSFTLSGLSPDTDYTGAYEIDGVVFPRVFKFRTFPRQGRKASFSFTAFNCLGNGLGSGYSAAGFSNSPALLHVGDKNPLFNMIVGDWGYYDIITDNQAGFRAAWLNNLSQVNQQALLDNTSLVYMFDDHDGPGNNGNRTSASVPAMLANYREQMPCYPLQPSGPVYHSFTVGRVLFIIGDGRSSRDPNNQAASSSKTMLGLAQRTWMLDLLENTDAAAVIWVISSIWHDTSANGADTWASFSHERDTIAAAVTAYRARGGLFVAINGDNHAMSIDDGTNNPWGGFPIFHFGALDCEYNFKGVWSHGFMGGYGNFGTVEVEDTGDAISIVGTGWSNTRRWVSLRASAPADFIPPGLYRVSGGKLLESTSPVG